MSLPTRQEVNDAVASQFRKCWNDPTTGAATIKPYTPEVRWWNLRYAKVPPIEKTYVEFAFRTLDSRQITFRGTEIDNKRFERYRTLRLVVVEFYFSYQEARDGSNEDLIQLARNAFVQPILDQCILFRDVIGREAESAEDFQRATVTAQFEYDELIGAN